MLPGQYFDQGTGLYYNYFRTYNPATGRYIKTDPIGLNGGLNIYGYVENNPLRWIDQKGLVKWSGTVTNGALTAIVGAGGYYFTLETECINGKKGYVEAVGAGIAFGVGGRIPLGKWSLEIIGGGGSGKIEFEDHETTVDPSQFNGEFIASGAGLVIGAGFSHYGIQCGSAFAKPTGLSYGLDVGINAVIGSCTVIKAKVEDCCGG